MAGICNVHDTCNCPPEENRTPEKVYTNELEKALCELVEKSEATLDAHDALNVDCERCNCSICDLEDATRAAIAKAKEVLPK